MKIQVSNWKQIGTTVIFSILLLVISMVAFSQTLLAEVQDGLTPGPVKNKVVWEQNLWNVTNSDGVIQLVLKDGIINEDAYDKGRMTGATGKFVLQLLDESGKILSEKDEIIDENSLFGFQTFKLIFDDYNNDRAGDFTFGQWVEGEMRYRYKIYTIKDGKISILPVKGEDYIYNSAGFSNSVLLVKNGNDGFKTYEYETYNPTEYVEKTYAWDGRQFVQADKKTFPLVSEENKKADITYMDLWPQYGISIYTKDGKPESNIHKGYYVFVRGRESYFPDWTAQYPLTLQSLDYNSDPEIFGVYFEKGNGTSESDGDVLTFSSRKMEPVSSWPWTANNFNLAIYLPGSVFENAYEVSYNNKTVETPPENTESIDLLMVNGGMYPNADIQISDGTALLRADILVDCFGAGVDTTKNDKLTISLDGVRIEMTMGTRSATINGKPSDMPISYKLIDGNPYIPIRFVCEAFGYTMGYHGSGSAFGMGKSETPYATERGNSKALVNIITIERPEKDAKELTPEQGLNIVKAASHNTYLDTADYMRLSQRNFDENYPDYDYNNINYTGLIVGRYYVYSLKDFDDMNIYFNKYTGEIFAEHAGLPFVSVSRGFINIPWMYQ